MILFKDNYTVEVIMGFHLHSSSICRALQGVDKGALGNVFGALAPSPATALY